jgi:superoxide reductase
MSSFCDLCQTADWKSEKHVPVIECQEMVSADLPFDVCLTVGKEIAHPNTMEHHIRWIKLYFQPEGDKFSYEVGGCEFNSHGECVEGPNKGNVYTYPTAVVKMKIKKSGVLFAASYCNIHGLWQSSKPIKLS